MGRGGGLGAPCGGPGCKLCRSQFQSLCRFHPLQPRLQQGIARVQHLGIGITVVDALLAQHGYTQVLLRHQEQALRIGLVRLSDLPQPQCQLGCRKEFAATQLQLAFRSVTLALQLAQHRITMGLPFQRDGQVNAHGRAVARLPSEISADGLRQRNSGFHRFAAQVGRNLVCCIHFQPRLLHAGVFVHLCQHVLGSGACVGPNYGVCVQRGDAAVGQPRQFAQGALRGELQGALQGFGGREQAAQSHSLCWQHVPGLCSALQRCLDGLFFGEKSLGQCNALHAMQVAHIGLAYGLHRFLLYGP